MKMLTLGYSPCPNDTFIFYALVHGRVAAQGIEVVEELHDVEELNRMALDGELDITKVSFSAYASLRESYCLLRTGGALGRGCGPLVVAPEALGMEALRGKRIAIPGMHTTAYLLLRLYDPAFSDNVKVYKFDEIMQAVAGGDADAGLIIHESRFTYAQYGLKQVADLGAWWEETTGQPIPLGCIIARRELGTQMHRALDSAIRESLEYAWKHSDETAAYITAHAQEMSDEVVQQHIGLYVNEFTRDLGAEGQAAIQTLYRRAEAQGIIAPSHRPLFCY